MHFRCSTSKELALAAAASTCPLVCCALLFPRSFFQLSSLYPHKCKEQTMSGSRFVACPVCQASVHKLLINSHLDACPTYQLHLAPASSADCGQAPPPLPAKKQRLVGQESHGTQEDPQRPAAKAVQLKATEPIAWLRFPGVRTKAPVLSNEHLRSILPCEVRPTPSTAMLSAA